jgi:5-methylcytosine-specific restriction protein A
VVPTTSDTVYRTWRWIQLSRSYRRLHPVCQRCSEDLATEVHHVVPIEAAPQRAYDLTNLISVCRSCHKSLHHSE